MATSRVLWERGLREDHAKLAANIRFERDGKIKEIRVKWREGFKALKKENDRLLLEVQETFHNGMAANDTWLREQLSMGPPK